MNQITRAASDMAEGGMILAVLTVLFMAFFIGVIIWLFTRKPEEWEETARLAIDDGDQSVARENTIRSI